MHNVNPALSAQRKRQFSQLIIWGLFGLALLLGSAGFIRIIPALLRIPDSLDFAAYYVAARVLNAGAPLYDPLQMAAAATSDGQQVTFAAYIYPPFIAALLRPLGALPFGTAKTIWFALNIISLFVSMVLLARLVRLPARWAALVAVIACLMPPVYDTLLLGQVNCVLLVLIVGSLYLALSPRSNSGKLIAAGALLGLAASIKLFPIIIVAVYLVYHKYAAIAATVVFMLIASTLGVALGGLDNTLRYVNVVAPQLASVSPLPVEQSVWSVARRLFSVNTIQFAFLTTDNAVTFTLKPLVDAPLLGYLLSLLVSIAVLCVTALAMIRTRALMQENNTTAPLLCASLMLAAFMLANTIVHDHYHMLLLIPLFLLVALYQRCRSESGHTLIGLALGSYCLCIVLQRYWRVAITIAPSPLLLAFGFLGALMLWGTLVRLTFVSAREGVNA